MSAKDWLPILNWKGLPPFADIYEMDRKKFLTFYYDAHPDIQELTSNLLSGLRGEYPPNNMRIFGLPGIGKTTFLHYIKARLELDEEEGLDHTYLFILDCRELVTENEISEDRIDDCILRGIEAYFDNCSINTTVVSEIRLNDKLSPRQKIDKLLDYLVSKKSEFKKQFVIALDAVDTIKDLLIIPLLTSITNRLHQSSIKKWLFIRDVKYNSLNEDIRINLNSFFPEPHSFPRVDLHEIFSHRIKIIENAPDAGKNPFEKRLCSLLCNIFNFDLRQSISMLHIILNAIPPKEIKEHTDEKFITNYISRMAIQVLIRSHIIPNIYDYEVAAMPIVFPIQKEVLQLVAHRQRIDKVFHFILQSELISKLTLAKIFKNIDEIEYDKNLVEDALRYLLRQKIIEEQQSADMRYRTYQLTPLGWELEKIVDQDFYIQICREALEQRQIRFPENYWNVSTVKSDYYSLVMEKMFGITVK